MLAISVMQPWAHAIIFWNKDIENREWRPDSKLIGDRIAIHASKKLDQGAMRALRCCDMMDRLSGYALGAIIGTVRVAGIVDNHSSRWWTGPYGIVLAEPLALREPIPASGALGLWRLTPKVRERIAREELAA